MQKYTSIQSNISLIYLYRKQHINYSFEKFLLLYGVAESKFETLTN